ncbi:MAG: hypothetical protein JXM73_00290 [Anaerolineae bacterium]|nr:hypothetical protein [Anaerolineae bacterium]
MAGYGITREEVLAALRAGLEPLPYTHAMWEGGAVSWERLDAWSDIDVMVDADDERVEEALECVDRILESTSPIELKLRMPDDAAGNYIQAFYRLRDASPYLLVDAAVLRHGATSKFLEPEVHGRPIFYFDKSGVSRLPHFDLAAWQASELAGWLANTRTRFEIFQVMVLKELNRGNLVEAVGYYHAYTLRPLLSALNMRYRPERHGFGVRYVYYELPPEVTARLERLFLPVSLADLRAKQAEAEEWFRQVTGEIAQEINHKGHEGN